MGDVRLTAGNRGRALIAGVAACLLLLQSFAIILSPNGSAALSHGDQAAALALAGELCGDGPHDGRDAPASHHHHCALCITGNRDLSLDAAVLLIATLVVLTLPQGEASPAWVRRSESKPSLAGWASSWSSRGPPSFS